MFSVSSGCRYDVQRQGLHGASAIVIVSKNVRWVQKTGIRVQNKNRSQRATGLRSTRRFSVRRALTPHRIRSATSPAAPTAMERTRWSCGTVHSLAPVRVPPFGPCGAPRPRRSGRSTQPARPNRELSKLSFASCFSFFSGRLVARQMASRMSAPCRVRWRRVMPINTTSPITKRRANLLVKNSLDQIFGRRTGSTAFAKPNMLYGLLLSDPVQWA